jgi:hypothetical protein
MRIHVQGVSDIFIPDNTLANVGIAASVVTTDGTAVEIGRIPFPSGSGAGGGVFLLNFAIVAVQSGTGHRAFWQDSGGIASGGGVVFFMDSGNPVNLTPTLFPASGEVGGDPDYGWRLLLTYDGTSLIFALRGVVAQTISWRAQITGAMATI